MSAEAAAVVLGRQGLSTEEKFLLFVVADSAGFDRAFEISVARCASDCGLPVPTAERMIRSFAEAGLLTVHKTDRGGSLWVELNLEAIGKLPLTEAAKRRAVR